MTSFDNLNFKGAYRAYDADGKLLKYKIGDSVTYKGSTYVANRMVTETSPAHGEVGGWTSLQGGGVAGVRFYWGGTRPIKANVGDEWFDLVTAKTYKYLSDGNTEQWVNIY